MRLSRLCPVPGVRARGRADERLGSIWQSGTRDVHEASDALIRGKAPLAFSDPKLWAELLSQFYYVFRALETALERGAATDSRVHALHSTFFSRLARSSAFLSDVRQRLTAAGGCRVPDFRSRPCRLPTTAGAPLLPRRCPRRRNTRTE